MKIAYCIICHKNTLILQELVKQLGNNDIYIHIDKKSNIENFKFQKNDNIQILNNRIDVKWGGFSQIQVMLNLLNVTKEKSHDYIFLLSGDDLPLKTDQEIKKILFENKGQEFIGISKNNEYIDKRINILYDDKYFKKNKNCIERIMIKIQSRFNLYRKNKYFKDLPRLYKGSNWFGITSQCRDYIFDYLNEHPDYLKAFEKSYCGDEVFFQTIICNSIFRNKIHDLDNEDDNLSAKRYIDWKSGPDLPRTLDEGDFLKIKQSNALFARKFSEKLDINYYKDYFFKDEK